MTKKTKMTAAERAVKEKELATLNALSPEATASAVAVAFGKDVFGEMDHQRFYEVLHQLNAKNDSPQTSEKMLLSQAHALDVMFANLARRAASHIGCNMLAAMETYMRLALRAQNQARMTLETLAAIKNPPVVFAKQANIANNQQVNNGEAVPVARARETGKPQTELLEAPHARPEWMDTRAARAAKDDDSVMATVEAIDRAAHEGGQGDVEP